MSVPPPTLAAGSSVSVGSVFAASTFTGAVLAGSAGVSPAYASESGALNADGTSALAALTGRS